MLTHRAWTGIRGLHHGFGERADPPGPPWTAGTGRPVVVPRQVHGTRVVTADATADRPQADALATATPGTFVGIQTADCVPVLLIDRARRVAAAVHAGWRGAAGGILEAAVAHVEATWGSNPADLDAVIGPAIGQCCFEVGDDVRDAFAAAGNTVPGTAWERRAPKWHFDLRAAVQARLIIAGVAGAVAIGPCTRCTPTFHSYRRDGANAGRQLSFVGWG
jgi:YfiH family protein